MVEILLRHSGPILSHAEKGSKKCPRIFGGKQIELN